MATDRPTFSESWYRVGPLKPRLRSVVQTTRQQYRGHIWHILRDPANNKFYRLDEPSYHFVGLLDGNRTIDDAWKKACADLHDAAPTQGEVIQTLGQLYQNNLLDADITPDVSGMFERQRERKKREVGGYLMNLLFSKIPVWDPDRFLNHWTPLVGWIFSPIGFLLWTVLIIYGVFNVINHGSQFFNQASAVLSPSNLGWLFVSTIIIKLVHESGHAFACKYFGNKENRGGVEGIGGEVHTIGVMFVALIPMPYVDTSSSWTLRNKLHRAFIGAAGMYLELAIAAVAAIVWANTAMGTVPHAVAYNMIFIASVTTFLFNANPLIRFDGYYILSDLTEMPNLANRSKEYLYCIIKKYIYGVPNPNDPSHSAAERPWLLTYALSSAVYRVFISVGIILFVADKLIILGLIMALSTVIGMVIVPFGKWMHYLFTSGELRKNRTRALTATFSTAFVAFLLIGAIPMPDRSRAQGFVRPDQITTVYAETEGYVEAILPSGAFVHPDDDLPLVELRNVHLEFERDKLTAQKHEYLAKYRKNRTEDIASAKAMREHLDAIDEEIKRADRDVQRLNVKAPFTGNWIVGNGDSITGQYVQRGQEIGQVASLNDMQIVVTANQFLGPRLYELPNEKVPVEIRIQGRPDLKFKGTIERVIAAGQRDLPSEALGQQAGGEMAMQQDEQSGQMMASEVFFEVLVNPDRDVDFRLYPGQRVVVQFDMPNKTVLAQGWRTFRQLIQTRFQI
ncbi:Peptidase family M50 [Poriferisphaera corsica]|uniref:Peptidase family M50 n=1 Tax=Poriferisphaera corsica TaxID=2528020 RepID=A0A517YSV5_9BACT|nr:efflux RND transporter periplasmic adaptor subunit [Poriferisphaera corsica]QDU33291.1 Peptidase family M50 [Poriferisphaera corsica]